MDDVGKYGDGFALLMMKQHMTHKAGGGTWLLGQAATQGMGKKKTADEDAPASQDGGGPGGAKT